MKKIIAIMALLIIFSSSAFAAGTMLHEMNEIYWNPANTDFQTAVAEALDNKGGNSLSNGNLMVCNNYGIAGCPPDPFGNAKGNILAEGNIYANLFVEKKIEFSTHGAGWYRVVEGWWQGGTMRIDGFSANEPDGCNRNQDTEFQYGISPYGPTFSMQILRDNRYWNTQVANSYSPNLVDQVRLVVDQTDEKTYLDVHVSCPRPSQVILYSYGPNTANFLSAPISSPAGSFDSANSRTVNFIDGLSTLGIFTVQNYENAPSKGLFIINSNNEDHSASSITFKSGGGNEGGLGLNAAGRQWEDLDETIPATPNYMFFHNSIGGFTFHHATNELMRITPAGNVGIGTDAPASKLDVKGGIQVFYNPVVDDSYYLGGLKISGGGIFVAHDYTSIDHLKGDLPDHIATGLNVMIARVDNPGIYISNNNGPSAIFANGNVGIGTTAPAYGLDIRTADSTLQIKGMDNFNSDPSILLSGEGGYPAEGFKLWYDNNYGVTYFDNYFTGGHMIFRTKTGSTSGTPDIEAMRIQHDGTVIIRKLEFTNENLVPIFKVPQYELNSYMIMEGGSACLSEQEGSIIYDSAHHRFFGCVRSTDDSWCQQGTGGYCWDNLNGLY